MRTNDTRPPITYRARRHLWLRPGEHLVCPNGHRLKHNTAILRQGALICQTRPSDRGGTVQGECNARVYVLQMPSGLRFVAEITPAEMQHMRDRAMDVEQVLAYLHGSTA